MKYWISALFAFYLICPPTVQSDEANTPRIDVSNCLIYGPGLSSEIVLPVRYFFIQLVDVNGKNLSQSPGDNILSISVDIQPKSSHLRLQNEILNLNDGSFVVRIRLFESLLEGSLTIRIAFKNYSEMRGVVLRAPLYSETCNCPQLHLTKWLQKLNCSAKYEQIEEDFRIFPEIDGDLVAEKFNTQHTNPHSFAACRYIVKSNRIYRKCFGEHTGFRMFSDHALLSLAWKTYLPDMDFIMNLGDWPLSSINYDDPLPIVSWCGSNKTHDIVVPSYETMEWVLGMMNRVNLDVFRALAHPHYNWSEKIDKGIWRGRDSSEARLDLVRFSLANPDYVDARLTAMFFFTNDSTLGQLFPAISFTEFFRFRYLINLDGTVAAYRLGLLFAGKSLVLKQNSIYYEHFYNRLKDMEHFISIQSDLKDLKEKIEWAKKNQKEVSKIASNGRQFLKDEFLPTNILCYYGRVLEKFSSRQIKGKIHVDSSFTEVLQPEMMTKENCLCEKTKHYSPPIIRDEL